MFRIVLRFKSQNVMLFYTWPFNPRPPLFKGGLCLPLLKVPKRCRPETILLRCCANHRRIRASPKIEKCAESGAMPENLAKARSVIKAGVSRSRVCAVHQSCARRYWRNYRRKRHLFKPSRSDAKTAVRHGGKNYAQPCERHTRTESAQTRPSLNSAGKTRRGTT